MSNHSTVTYFRTTLDPLDIYRLERIIDHGEDMDVTTPAAALAVYLRGIDPSLRWHRTSMRVDSRATGAVKGMGEIVDDDDVADLMYFDAAVFTHGTNRAVVMGLKPLYFPASQGPIDRTLRIIQPPGRYGCLSWATSLPVAYTVDYHAASKDPSAQFSKSTDAAWLTDFSDPIRYLDVQFYSSLLSRGSDGTRQATDAPAPEVAGFTQVPWDHPTWLYGKRPQPGMDMFTDSSHATNEDELTSIVSCIRQGGDIDSIVTIEVLQ